MHIRPRFRSVFFVIFLSGLSLGCGEDFDPQSKVEGLEVMAIKAEPSAITLLQPTALTPLIHHEDPVTYRWTVCLFDLGALTGFECVDAALECCLGEDPTALLDPVQLATECKKDCFGESEADTSDVPPVDEEFLASVVKSEDIESLLVRLVVNTSDEEIEAVKRVTILQEGDTPNTNPVVETLTYEGGDCESEDPCPWENDTVLEVYPGETLTLALEVSPGTSGEEEQIPGMTVAWYATDGDVINFFSSGEEQNTQFKAPTLDENEDKREILLWAVARDGEGGTDWVTRKLQTIPNPDKDE